MVCRPFTLCLTLPKARFEELSAAMPQVAAWVGLSVKGASQDSFPELTQRKQRVKMSRCVRNLPASISSASVLQNVLVCQQVGIPH